jgi:hypothetical protein
MSERKSKNQKKGFESVEQWQDKYFPEIAKQNRLNKLHDDIEALGKAMAEDTLNLVKAQLLSS